MEILKTTLRQSCQSSSMKALPKIIRAQSAIQKTIWALALLVGMSAAVYQLDKLIQNYLDYATSVNIVTEAGSPPFPDVTICHMDEEWTFRVLENELEDQDTMTSYNQRINDMKKDYSPTSKEYGYLNFLNGFQGYLQNSPKIHTVVEKLRELFIIDCYAVPGWNRVPCSTGDTQFVNTSVFLDPWFGMCITFQSNTPDLKGLNVITYLDNPETEVLKDFNMADDSATHSRSVGARVVIHPPNSFPDIWLTSQEVVAGTDIAFNLIGTQRTVLDYPYGSCISLQEAEEARKAGVPGYAINRHGYECYRMCGKDHIQKNCDCIHLFYSTNKEERDNNELCGYVDDKNISVTFARLDCAGQTEMELNARFSDVCECPVPCHQFTYEYTTKTTIWPHDVYHISFYEQYIRNSPFARKFTEYENLTDLAKNDSQEALRQSKSLKKIQENFSQIRILNHQQSHFHYSETPLISKEALFGTVGGLLNLWVGITFITIIEIIEFGYNICKKKKEVHRDNQTHVYKCRSKDPAVSEALVTA